MRKRISIYLFSLLAWGSVYGQDLSIQSFTLPTGTASAGGYVTPTITVSNIGTATAGYSYVGVYLSTDSVLNVSDTFLGSGYVSSLTAGTSSSVSADLQPLSSTLASGKYYLFVYADYSGAVSETNESNNAKGLSFTVAQPYIDLTISGISATSTSVTSGAYFSPTVSEYNSGNSTASYNYIGYYLSSDSTYSLDDTYLGSDYVYSLIGGSSTYDYPSLYIPTTTVNGSYYIIAKADYSDYVSETNETNNTRAIKISVAPATIDLQISSITASTTNIKAGDYFSPTVYESNTGNSTASYNYIGYYLSSDSTYSIGDTYLAGDYIYYLAGGSSTSDVPSLYIPTGTLQGQYYVIAVADYSNYVAETNENNNTRAIKVTVTPTTVDLTISSITSTSTNVTAGNYFYPTVYEANSGNSLSGNNYIAYYLSSDSTYGIGDTYLTSDYVYSVSGGSSVYDSPSLYIPSATLNGQYYIIAVADYSNYVTESNENNNTRAIKISVTPTNVDLKISSITATSTSLTAGTYFYPSVSEYNSGNSSAGYNYIGYYLSSDSTYGIGDTYLTSDYVYSTAAGSYNYDYPSLYIPSTTLNGQYYIIAVADYSNYVAETNENNNVRAIKISVAPTSIDLKISSITSSSTNVKAGSYFSPLVYEYNAGNSKASYNYIGYYLSSDSTYSVGDTYLTSDLMYSIYSGSSSYDYPSLYIPSTTPNGQYYIIAVADYSNYVTETNETNNTRAIKISVAPSAIDLTISSISATSTSLSAGTYLYPSVYEYNSGNSSAGYNYIGYYLSTDSTYSVGDTYLTNDYVSSLSAGSSTYDFPSLYIPSTTLSGQYYIIALADYSNYVTETNENNNAKALKITISVPSIDLKIASISASSTNLAAGTYFSPTVSETNSGATASGYNYIGYYLSTDSTYNVGDTYLTSDYVSSISGGSSAYDQPSLYIPSTTLNGQYYIIAVADNYNYVSETNESNNATAIKITVSPVNVDLKISSFTTTSSTLQAGSYFYPTAVEYNSGNSTASYNYIGYYLSTDSTYSTSDTYLTSDLVYSINGGAYAYDYPSLYIPSGTLDGQYYIIAVADYGSYVSETNEANNNTALKITIGKSTYDLSMLSFFTNTSVTNPGSTMYFQYAIQNLGSTSVSNILAYYYLSQDSVLNTSTDTFLGNDGYFTIASSAVYNMKSSVYIPTVTKGTYYLFVTAVDNYHTESNNVNNARKVKIYIDGPLGFDNDVTAAGKPIIYPNPSTGNITIGQFGNNDQIQVFDINNVQVYQSSIPNETGANINLQNLAQGVYLVKLMSQGVYTHTEKLVITK